MGGDVLAKNTRNTVKGRAIILGLGVLKVKLAKPGITMINVSMFPPVQCV